MQSSFSAPTFMCENAFRNCEQIACECAQREYCEESLNTEISPEESYEEIHWIEYNEPEEKLSLWRQILQESEEDKKKLEEWKKEREESKDEKTTKTSKTVEYLNREIFPTLLAGMTQMLIEAEKFNAIKNVKCRFNGLDYLAEYLWNKNPFHPERQFNWVGLFAIPAFKRWLQKNPRPIYPKSWLWSKQEAALIIQRNVRGWLVRNRKDVQELRQFWKILAAEGSNYISSLASVNLDEFNELFINPKESSMDLCKIIGK